MTQIQSLTELLSELMSEGYSIEDITTAVDEYQNINKA